MKTSAKFHRVSVINCSTKLSPDALEAIQSLSETEIHFVPDLPQNDCETIRAIGESDAVIASLSVDLTEAVFAATPKLKYLGVCGSSLRRVDLHAASRCRVHVSNVREYCDWDTSLFVVSEMLSLARGLGPKMWRVEPADIRGKTLGILGLGSVGLCAANLASSFGMNVQYFSRTRKYSLETAALRYTTKEELLATSHFLSIHTPPHVIALAGEEFNGIGPETALIVTTVGYTLDEKGFRSWMGKGENYAIFDSIAAEYCPKLESSEKLILSSRPAYLTAESRIQLGEKLVGEMVKFLDLKATDPRPSAS